MLNLWAHIKEKPKEEDLRSENSRLRDIIIYLKEENKRVGQERDSLSFALQSYPEKQLLNAVQRITPLMNIPLSKVWMSQHLAPIKNKASL